MLQCSWISFQPDPSSPRIFYVGCCSPYGPLRAHYLGTWGARVSCQHKGYGERPWNRKSCITQRVQVPTARFLWLQKPYPKLFLGPGTPNIGYLDPLGKLMPGCKFNTHQAASYKHVHQYSYGVDYRTLRWIYFWDRSTGLGLTTSCSAK